MKIRLICFIVISIIFVNSLGAISEDKKLSWLHPTYFGFKTIEKFAWVNVSVEGSAEKIGLKADELTDLLKLRFKNTFAGLKIEKPNTAQVLNDENERIKFGVIYIKVWQ